MGGVERLLDGVEASYPVNIGDWTFHVHGFVSFILWSIVFYALIGFHAVVFF